MRFHADTESNTKWVAQVGEHATVIGVALVAQRIDVRRRGVDPEFAELRAGRADEVGGADMVDDLGAAFGKIGSDPLAP